MAELHATLQSVAEVLRSAGLLVELRGPGDVAVAGVCQDSRRAEPGDLFLAWSGSRFDAHDYAAAAAAAGAVAVVVEHPVEASVPQIEVSDGRRAAALVADHVMGSPWRQMLMAGVTGTNGKTTTAVLARHLLEQRAPAAAIGTLGVMESGGIRPGTEGLTTPGPVQLSTWLRDLADGGTGSVVMEASSHALDQKRLDGVTFDLAAFTNLSQDHLDYHGDLSSYFEAKAKLVDHVAAGGTVVVDGDDSAWQGLTLAGRTRRTFSAVADADVRARDVRWEPGGARFSLEADEARAPVRLPLIGVFNVRNALAAAALALAAGMSVPDVAQGLSTAPQVMGRLEVVQRRPFKVVIDFAHTPDALDGVLDAVRPATEGRLIVVFGAGGDRDRGKRALMGDAVRRHADEVFLTSDNPRTEDPESILNDIEPGLAGHPFHRVVDRREAIGRALAAAGPGDTVLLAGKGHETYQVIGTEKRPFDERLVVREFLAGSGSA